MSFETIDADIELETEEASSRETELIHRLHEVIQSEWPHHTRAKIRSLGPSSSDDSTVIIRWVNEGDERLLGGYTDALLKHGWAIAGMKNLMTFVAPVVRSREDGVAYRFEGRSGEINETYGPEPCEVCGDREFVEFVDVEVDVDVEARLEAGKHIPQYHYRSLRLCDECDLPDHLEEYENEDGEPDFDPREHPEYDPYGEASDGT